MSDFIIEVNELSKAYRIGLQDQRSDTLGAAVVNFVKSPLRNFKRLRSLSNIESNDTSNDIFWALKDISFNISKGDILGVIGRNGAGKSTLLKVLSKITEPTHGEIRIRGRIASLLEVGTGFNPDLTGRENVYLNGTILGMTKKEIDKKFDEIISFSNVEKFIDTPVKRYSSGMKVRLGFSVAAFLDPEILFIDEVLAVGDAEFQKKCIGKMQDISSSSGKTIVFVSHDMTAISSLCNRALLLDSGKVISNEGTESAILKYVQLNSSSTEKWNFNARKGDQTFAIKDILFYNVNNQITKSFLSGEQISIKVLFTRTITVQDYNKLYIVIEFSNALKKKIFSISNKYSPNKPIEEKDYVLCQIPKLLLTAGDYFMDIWISYSGGLSDEIREFGKIEVVSNDYYNTGYQPVARKHGEMLIDQIWS
jgi:lipopolysaccharide transport system ATP-binding protein